MGKARGGADCSSGDGVTSHRLYTVAKIFRGNVDSNQQSFVDAFNTQGLPLTQWLTLEGI